MIYPRQSGASETLGIANGGSDALRQIQTDVKTKAGDAKKWRMTVPRDVQPYSTVRYDSTTRYRMISYRIILYVP